MGKYIEIDAKAVLSDPLLRTLDPESLGGWLRLIAIQSIMPENKLPDDVDALRGLSGLVPRVWLSNGEAIRIAIRERAGLKAPRQSRSLYANLPKIIDEPVPASPLDPK